VPAPAPAGSCAEQLKSIRELFKTIPADFRDVQEPIEAIVDRVEKCNGLLEKFLADCQALEGAHDAPYMNARLLMSLSKRRQYEWFQQFQGQPEKLQSLMKDYYDRIIRLSRACLAKGDDKDPLRPNCHDLIGDASFQNRDYQEALKNYKIITDQYPGFPEIANTILAMGQCYLEMRRTAEGIAFIRKAIEERQADPSLPNFYEVSWKLLEAAGDLDGMEKHCREVQKVFPVRLLKQEIGRVEEEDYRRYLGYSGFRLGHVLFAKGDIGGAHQAFSQHIEEMGKREAELQAQGRALPQELNIFRNRSIDIARVIDQQAGKPAGDDLGGVLWATPQKLQLSPGLGKAVAIVFRGIGDTRSAGLLKALDRHLGSKPEKKALLSISFLKDAGDPQVHLQEARDELAGLGLQNTAAGLDPDQKGKSLFRAFKVMVGSATFIILDGEGKLGWYQQDPREVDGELAIRIWERIAGR
jgi:tetratricopeptide (TPR) repeat protein